MLLYHGTEIGEQDCHRKFDGIAKYRNIVTGKESVGRIFMEHDGRCSIRMNDTILDTGDFEIACEIPDVGWFNTKDGALYLSVKTRRQYSITTSAQRVNLNTWAGGGADHQLEYYEEAFKDQKMSIYDALDRLRNQGPINTLRYNALALNRDVAVARDGQQFMVMLGRVPVATVKGEDMEFHVPSVHDEVVEILEGDLHGNN